MESIKKFYIILFFVTCLSFSQNNEYFNLIDQAEIAIVNSDFKEANSLYQKAFNTNTESFVLDIINYSKCNCFLSDKIQKNAIITLLQKGLSIKELRKDVVLKKCIKKNDAEFKDIEPIYDSLYRKQIQQLGYDDQFYRLKKGSYVKYRKEIDSIDYNNINTFIELVDEKGFPSEAKIGVENRVGWQEWIIVVLHYQQQRSKDKSKPDITKILKKAVDENKLRPSIYAHLAEMQNDSIYRKYYHSPLVMIEKGEYRIFKSTLDKVNTIDEEREKIGMSSLKNQLVKFFFTQSKKNKYDFNFGYVDTYSTDLTKQSKELKEYFRGKSVKVNNKNYDFIGK